MCVTNIVRDDVVLNQDFKDQLRRSQDSRYKTHLIWKNKSLSIQSNKSGSLVRVKYLLQNLQRKQLAERVMEKVNDEANITSENSIYLRKQLFVKMLKQQRSSFISATSSGYFAV